MTSESDSAPTVDWAALLGPGAQRDDAGHLTDLGDRTGELHTALADGGVMPLEAIGVIRVVGSDAADFLHAQLTQAVADQPVDQWRLAGLCNPKGRLFGLFRVVRLEQDDFLLLTDRALVDGLVQRLRMFVLRSRVALQDFTPHVLVAGATGSGAAALTEATGTLPQGTGTVGHAGDASVLHLGGTPERFLLVAHARDASGLWAGLTGSARVCTPDAWRLLTIRSGEPVVYADTRERFIPQQVNLDLIEGVSFQKGCWPGQEVVARMHYRGAPSRRMAMLTAPGEQVPLPGDSVLTAEGGSAGDVVDAVAGPAGVEALAVLRVAHHGREDLRLAGQPAGFGQLPYTVPLPEQATESD